MTNQDSSSNQPSKEKVFGRYQVIKELGRGGMGQVYLAYDPQLEHQVALKMLLPKENINPKDEKRFLREATATAKLSHPHIVKVYESGFFDNKCYFSMEFIDGHSLKEVLSSKSLSQQQLLQIMIEIVKAVSYAHSHGIIHRDLKPDNIIITKDLQPKIMDFGLVKLLEDESSGGLTKTGAILGTIFYMAPDQATGDSKNVDQRSDIYSLGAILYEMITGSPPFMTTDVLTFLRRVTSEDPIPPNKVVPGISKKLSFICLKAIQREKEDRYQSTDELIQDLEAFTSGKKVATRTIKKQKNKQKSRTLNQVIIVLIIITIIAILTILLYHFS